MIRGSKPAVRIRNIIFGALVVVAAFVVTTFPLDLFWPLAASLQQNRPALVAVPPLQPLTGMTATVAINDLPLVGVAYDDKTLRVIANAAGTASAAIAKLAMQ